MTTQHRMTIQPQTADPTIADPTAADPTPVTPPPTPTSTPTTTPTPAPTLAEIDAADRRARHWLWPTPGPLPIGSDRHRDAACQMFHDTFNPYKPSVIAWPQLDPDALARLTSLPIWDIAVTTETKARARMLAYGEALEDPVWRDAISRNGWEEGRHKEVLSNLVASYGIALVPEPADKLPPDAEWGYLVTGYSECIDSFFAFGLFEVARRSGYFPTALVETFEPVIQEEARHILLFANWLAWHRKRLGPWRRLRFELRVIRAWIFLAWERVGLARDIDGGDKPAADNNFTLNGSKAVSDIDLKPLDLMAICLTENDRRFAGYDPRLLRPTTTPTLAALALRIGRLFRRRATPQAIGPAA
ncbi:ferritin-like domain-containing protein [Rhodopila sp.]|uniref:ferritin-like domain-containing protein n=1 Tax=Rhodopila sp. TaxID=2480087 RepID=UPI003D13F253